MIGDHFPLCEQYISGDGLPCICDLLSLHADAIQAAAQADLRAKAFASPLSFWTRDEVLNLIDGSNE